MGARQSKRSVDISNPPKKGELENGVEEGGKLERLEEGDVNVVKATQNGNAPHAEKEASSPVTEEAAPVVNGETEKETEKEKAETKEEEQAKSEEKKDESLVNGAADSAEVTSPEKSTDEAATPDTDKKKKKEKSKKKWSFRSISFSRKDKSKPNVNKDESKNGNVTKEEPVAEVVEAEAAANTEALPVKDDEPKKEEAAAERTEEEKKEEKAEEPAPAPAPTPAPEPAVETSHLPLAPPAPVTPAPVTPAPVEPEPTPEPEPAATPAQPETPAPAPAPIVEPEVVEIKTEAKSEELPPPLPASPPPTEAPPPTPVAPTPAPVETETLTTEADTQETEVVGGGGESMAEPEDVEPVLDSEDKSEDLPAPPLINGFNHDDEHQIEELSEKVEIVVTENLKTIVTESIISQENSEDQSEQTASAAE